ncbi:hypothetical protein DNTS_014161 [Danionella cerebrum]|uniref:Ig-like domain-containing protein n=1 Tax=Danionella cerebrum TaxID=2873325 RepID=A0A553R7Y3_9TELE|nr:hypothetical protein DNTS_014161 [Danionella translucida]
MIATNQKPSHHLSEEQHDDSEWCWDMEFLQSDWAGISPDHSNSQNYTPQLPSPDIFQTQEANSQRNQVKATKPPASLVELLPPESTFLTALIILQQHFSAVDSAAPAPAPSLSQTSMGSSVELQCQAPQGHSSLEFKLFRVQELIDTVKHPQKQQTALFTLREDDWEKENLYCCQYENSMYSMYLQIKLKVVNASPPPSPHLVVEPSSGLVMPGEMLSFLCRAPYAAQNQPPHAFLLLRRARGTAGSMVAPAKLVSQSPDAHFHLKATGQDDGGEYVCLYQLKAPKTLNSTDSQPVQITVIELPVPTISLSQLEGEIMECTGSPAYPQAFFSLFHVGVLTPIATHQASMTQHSARFSIPVRYEHGTQYQCQYSVSLRDTRAYSKMSTALTVPCIKGYHDCTTASAGTIDLALVIGSVSAGVVFLMVVSLLGFAVHRHIKSNSEQKRKREQEKLWQHVHCRDHVLDLTLQRADIGSEEPGGTLRGEALESEPIYDYPMSTFKNSLFL